MALNDNGPIFANAYGSLLTLDIGALSPAILPLTTVDLAHGEAAADSDADLDAIQAGGQRSASLAGTTGDTALLGAPVDLQTNTASAPAPEANEDVLIPLDLAPLLNIPVIRTTAVANWVSDTECVAGDVPLSRSDQSLADLELLGIAAGQSVVALDTDDADGAADTETSTWLVPIAGAGDPRAVQARTTTTITSANVLNGLAGPGSAIQADVIQSPNYIVTASGLPGGASVTGPQPAVAVTIAGEPLITIDEKNETVDATLTDIVLGDLVDLNNAALLDDIIADLGLPDLGALTALLGGTIDSLLGGLQPVVRLSMPYSESIAADGTSASIDGALLRVEVLAPGTPGTAPVNGLTAPLATALSTILAAIGADAGEPLLSVDVAPFAAAVEAPAGGINCAPDDNPLRELNKHASAAEVAPGGTFDYNIAVPNRGDEVITGVVVTDTITGPGFEVIGTEGAPATINGGTVTFDVGDIDPNETVNLRITVKVAADAPDGSTFDDHVVVTGTYKGKPVTQEDDLLDIPEVKTDFTGDCSVQYSNKDASHKNVVPGETFSYYVHAFNSGAKPCTDVVITDTLDDRVAFVSCNLGCDNQGQTVTWTLDSLAGGSSVVLSVVVEVKADATGTLANSAIIDPGNGDPKTVTKTGPVVGDTSVINDPISPRRGPSSMPRTGGAVPLGVAVALGGSALALFALRRRLATA